MSNLFRHYGQAVKLDTFRPPLVFICTYSSLNTQEIDAIIIDLQKLLTDFWLFLK